ncbi:MAG: hypothetical protein MK538_07380 [Planctomycetes bacterium]|nr:hypothetical protein [Planctomycetota bacterium]
MKLRLTLLLLFAVGVIVAVFTVRGSKNIEVDRWRVASRFFFQEMGDVRRAEEIIDRVLKVVPDSSFDLGWKARILERKGTEDSLREAISLYDQILADSESLTRLLNLYKAAAHRRIGEFGRARASALSIADEFPFEAQLDLGETALAAAAPLKAISYYETALEEFAVDMRKQALAYESLGDAYSSLRRTSTLISRTDEPEGAASNDLESVDEKIRETLDKALSLVRQLPEQFASKDDTRTWIARVALKRAAVRRPGESTCRETAEFLELRASNTDDESYEKPSHHFYLSLGRLYLEAADHEADTWPERSREQLQQKATKYLYLALGERSTSENKALLDSLPMERVSAEDDPDLSLIPEIRAWKEYLNALVEVSKTILGSSQYRRILDDPSELELATRLRDGATSSQKDVVRICRLITAFAYLKDGQDKVAQEEFEQFLESTKEQRRARAALGVAEQCSKLAPSNSIVFKFLDLAEPAARETPFLYLSRQVRLLLKMSVREPLAEESAARLKTVLDRAAGHATTPDTSLTIAGLLDTFGERERAIDILRKSKRRNPKHQPTQRMLADLLLEHGNQTVRSAPKDTADPEAIKAATNQASKAYEEALFGYVHLFVQSPARNLDAFERSIVLLRVLETKRPGTDLTPVLRKTYPEAREDALNTMTLILRSFLGGEHVQAIEHEKSLLPKDSKPFVSFLVGSSHLKLAAEAERQRRYEQRDEFRENARKAFAGHPAFLPNQLELLGLELLAYTEKEIPDNLMQRITNLSQTQSYQHQAFWLLAQALRGRLHHLLVTGEGDSPTAAITMERQRTALRQVIVRQATFSPAYIALADSFVWRRPGQLLAEPDYNRAVHVLQTTPRPNEKVFSKIADYLESAGEPAKARRYRQVLVLVTPTEDDLSRLVHNYLVSGEVSVAKRFLLENAPALPEDSQTFRRTFEEKLGAAKPGAERLSVALALVRQAESNNLSNAVLAALRRRLADFDVYEGVRQLILGDLRTMESGIKHDATAREEARAYYQKAMEAYEVRKRPIPVQLLNNLAWNLLMDSDPNLRQDGLELARRAMEHVTEPREIASVRDTYAWGLHLNGQSQQAESEFRELLKIADLPSFRYRLAQILFDTQRYREALAEVERVIVSAKGFRESQEGTDLKNKILRSYRDRMSNTRNPVTTKNNEGKGSDS